VQSHFVVVPFARIAYPHAPMTTPSHPASTPAGRSLRYRPVDERRRTLADLCVAFFVAVTLLILNVLLNMNESVRGFFTQYSRAPGTSVLVNALLVWLAVMLLLAFYRWRESVRRRDELEDVLNSISPDALLVVDQNRDIVMCNSSVELIFGLSQTEVIGQKTETLYYDRRTNPRVPHEVYEALIRDGFHIGVATGKHKSGGTVPLEIISAELSGRRGAVLLLRDTTERERLEAQRRRLEQRAHQAQKLESLGVLAGGVAHDLNNQLMVIQGYTDLTLMNLPDQGPLRDGMSEIEKATVRAAELCAGLLSFSGRRTPNFLDVHLSDVAHESGRMMSVSIGSHVEVRYCLDAALAPIQGDSTQVQQVAMNLIKNAVEAVGSRQGLVIVTTGRLSLGEADLGEFLGEEPLRGGEYAFLSVEDNGCGMSEATRARICDPFFTTKSAGHGMGLAAVLGIVRGHRGGMRVESREGEGSKFTVLFPYAQPE
jgi:PAS domain S-box-containing protein